MGDDAPLEDLSESCDPFDDPLEACGSEMACDLDSLTCVPATGTGTPDDACSSIDDCAPGLVCLEDRCRVLCDPELEEDPCPVPELCARADDPVPGVCRDACFLLDQVCEFAEDGCNLVSGIEGTQAACTQNLGMGQTGDACTIDGDCLPGWLCTPQAVHAVSCAGGAASCCAPICDAVLLPCFGLEPSCRELGIPGQEESGFCGSL